MNINEKTTSDIFKEIVKLKPFLP